MSRPEIARIRGVASESAVGTLLERGLIQESGRSQFGAVLYRTSDLFEKLFGLSGLDELPDVTAFDPTPEEEGTLRDRLLGPASSAPLPRRADCRASASTWTRSRAGASSRRSSGSTTSASR